MMIRIVILEEREYAKRLSDYIERHLSVSARVCSFSSVENMLIQEEEADLYIVGVDFLNELSSSADYIRREKILQITKMEKEDGFFRFSAPKKILPMILQYLAVEEVTKISEDSGQLIAVLSPRRNILRDCFSYFEPGSLFLGLEDVGEYDRRHHMGDLCYFIKLREESILSQMKEMLSEKEGVYYLPSPELYFDLLEMTEDDYEWFFQRLKEEHSYTRIYIGFGCSSLRNCSMLRRFHQVIIMDSGQDRQITEFCNKMADMIRRTEGCQDRVLRWDLTGDIGENPVKKGKRSLSV